MLLERTFRRIPLEDLRIGLRNIGSILEEWISRMWCTSGWAIEEVWNTEWITVNPMMNFVSAFEFLESESSLDFGSAFGCHLRGWKGRGETARMSLASQLERIPQLGSWLHHKARLLLCPIKIFTHGIIIVILFSLVWYIQYYLILFLNLFLYKYVA